MKIGYDYYSIEKDRFIDFLDYIKKTKISIYHVFFKEDKVFFYSPTYYRYKIKYHQLQLINTVGIMKYFFIIYKNKLNIIGVICFFISLYLCSLYIFDIHITGTLPDVEKQFIIELKNEGIHKYTPLLTSEKLNDVLMLLKKNFKESVEYINVYQTGSVFHIDYTKRKQDSIETENYKNLYAKKDGLIYQIDVDSGNILIKRNDYVKKGDLLVENKIISTQDEIKILPVKGHIYAYTFYTIEESIKNNKQDRIESFYDLLLKIRSQLPVSAKIDKENVLQISSSSSKISLKMHYTLIEDIAIKGDNNERSH